MKTIDCATCGGAGGHVGQSDNMDWMECFESGRITTIKAKELGTMTTSTKKAQRKASK